MKMTTNYYAIIAVFAWAIFLLSSSLAHAVVTTTTYYHTDALGSIVAASDEEGGVIWRKTYDSYGREVISTDDGQVYEGQAYTGKPYDKETGLLYLNQRYYDPQLRRFISMDPVGFTPANPTSFNRYAYANNNPYKFVDPDGRAPLLVTASRRDISIDEAMRRSAPFTVTTRIIAGTGVVGGLSVVGAASPGAGLLIGSRFPTATAIGTELTVAEIGATTGGLAIATKGIKTVVPTLSSGVKVQAVGRDVIKWGSGADEALAITNNLTRNRANEILNSVSRSDIVKIRDWYRGVARDVGPAKLAQTPTPAYRADMMQRILDLAD